MDMDVIEIACQVYSLPLTHAFGLDDEKWWHKLINYFLAERRSIFSCWWHRLHPSLLLFDRWFSLRPILLLLLLFGSIFSLFFAQKLIFEILELIWQNKRLWKKAKLLWVFFLHQVQIFGQFVFVSDDGDPWYLGYSLITLDPIQDIWRYGQIKPAYIKFFRLGCRTVVVHLQIWIDIQIRINLLWSKIQVFGRLFNYWVLCIKYVYYQPRSFLLLRRTHWSRLDYCRLVGLSLLILLRRRVWLRLNL